jgi:hypothetical protein
MDTAVLSSTPGWQEHAMFPNAFPRHRCDCDPQAEADMHEFRGVDWEVGSDMSLFSLSVGLREAG